MFRRRQVRDSELAVLMHFPTVAYAHTVYWNPYQIFVYNLQAMLQPQATDLGSLGECIRISASKYNSSEFL